MDADCLTQTMDANQMNPFISHTNVTTNVTDIGFSIFHGLTCFVSKFSYLYVVAVGPQSEQ